MLVFQTGGDSTNLGGVSRYSLGFLITNGSNRHWVLAGNTDRNEQVVAMNTEDVYNDSKWHWYKLATS